jgi:hypothetical protein
MGYGLAYNKIWFNDIFMGKRDESAEYLGRGLISLYTKYVQKWRYVDLVDELD